MQKAGPGRGLHRRGLLGALGGVLGGLVGAPAILSAQPRASLRVGVLLGGVDPEADQTTRTAAAIAAEIALRRGRELTLSFAAAGGSPAMAERAALRLVEEGAELLLAATPDAETARLVDMAERRGVPVVVCCATLPGLTDRGARMLVRTVPTMSQLIGRGLGLLRDLHEVAEIPLPKRIAVVHGTDLAGQTARRVLAAVLPGANLPLEQHAEIAISTDPDALAAAMPDLLARLRRAAPEVILVEAPPASSCVLLTGLLSNGVSPHGLASFGLAGLAAPEVLRLGKAGEGHVTFSPWPDPRSPVTAEARTLYERRGPGLAFEHVQARLAITIDALLLVAEAIGRQPRARGPALALQIRGTVLAQKMMGGPPTRLDARGQNTAMPSVALQNRNGRAVVVLPQAVAEAMPRWPNPAMARS